MRNAWKPELGPPTWWKSEAASAWIESYGRWVDFSNNSNTGGGFMWRVGRVVKHHNGLKAHVFRRDGSDACTRLFHKGEGDEAKAWVAEQELIQRVRERLS